MDLEVFDESSSLGVVPFSREVVRSKYSVSVILAEETN